MHEGRNRVVIVTGAGRGIGEAIARRLADDGWTVIAVDRDGDGVERLVHAAGAARLHAARADVTDRSAVFALVDDVVARHGRVDAVVNNAMWVRYAPLDEMTEEVIDGMFAIGVKAALWLTQAVFPHFRRQGGGSIVNMSSPAATRGFDGSSAYSAVKGAVTSLTLQASRELGPDGIRVNAVVPGAVPTPGAREVVDDEGYEVRRSMAALRRLGTPDDIAGAVAFLVGDDARFITGHLLRVDGGL
ncbi:SDR family oxidoreductase [Microbacterium sp. P26]|uniref:SDR family NAD(P)-dependent oxidoreductase n=1 Tax=Microbacterium TaxID=33882 RepID=UPI00203D2C7B|nr:SDR family oxidoreductase [Microbacterium sp. P26]MCM3503171.1 SDR family oxidoreductase [Microbacterium sp. P26]